MRVRWTPGALADLREIITEISRNRPQTARAVASRLKSASNDLRDQPQVGRVVEEIGRHEIRERIVRPWRLVYRVLPDEIHVLAVVHSRRTLDERTANLTDKP